MHMVLYHFTKVLGVQVDRGNPHSSSSFMTHRWSNVSRMAGNLWRTQVVTLHSWPYPTTSPSVECKCSLVSWTLTSFQSNAPVSPVAIFVTSATPTPEWLSSLVMLLKHHHPHLHHSTSSPPPWVNHASPPLHLEKVKMDCLNLWRSHLLLLGS